MSTLKRISKAFQSAAEVIIDDSSRIVLMSDCHRGNGSFADEFLRNQNIYFAALMHYYNQNYTYIEVGDGDELWENRSINEIINQHKDVFWLLSKFYEDNRLYFIYGNHDMVKKDDKFVRENLYKYYDERKEKYVPLFKNIKVHEGLILRYLPSNDKIFLVHGHQVDCLNSTLWMLARFLVRYLWKPLNNVGINDLTRAAKNYKKKQATAQKLTNWTKNKKQMLISGHNHKPSFPDLDVYPYFNIGSCVHPRCITAIEIYGGNITLVKWSVKTKKDGTLFIGRDILAGPQKLIDYFSREQE
jgi:UDP-2,3-diacylglucosamine pyrophosphatase LpxH